MYTYEFNGTEYKGHKLFPIIPNVVTTKPDLDSILDNYQIGSITTVNVDKNSPKSSSLMSMSGISNTRVFLLSLFLSFIIVTVIYGVIYLNNHVFS